MIFKLVRKVFFIIPFMIFTLAFSQSDLELILRNTKKVHKLKKGSDRIKLEGLIKNNSNSDIYIYHPINYYTAANNVSATIPLENSLYIENENKRSFSDEIWYSTFSNEPSKIYVPRRITSNDFLLIKAGSSKEFPFNCYLPKNIKKMVKCNLKYEPINVKQEEVVSAMKNLNYTENDINKIITLLKKTYKYNSISNLVEFKIKR